MLVTNTTDIFKELFTLDNIAETYEDKIALKDFRGIDRMGRYQFERNNDMHFEIIQRSS